MPVSPYLQRIAKETGEPVSRFEPYWQQAKELTKEHFGKMEDSFEKKEWEFALKTVKQLAGIKESKISVQDFISTDKSVDDFITEAMVQSGDFPSLQTNVLSKDDDEDDEEDEFDEPVKEKKEEKIHIDYEDTVDDAEPIQEQEDELFINSPKRMEIQQQWVEEGDKLMINASYEDIDGKYKIEIRIPFTNKTQWVSFNSKADAKRYGFLPDSE